MDQREKVIDANLRFYEARADTYRDGRDNHDFRARYEPKFRRGLAATGDPRRALDCCAGTGVATRLLAEAGLDVTAVELSPRMAAMLADANPSAEVVCSEITAYLQETDRQWDLVVFGSAIHHLWNFDDVLALALGRLSPSGSVYLIGEPVLQQARAGRAIRSLELWLRRLSGKGPRAVIAGARRRLASRAAASSTRVPEAALGHFAEVYADGVPFDRVYAVLDRRGARIAWREITVTGSAPIRALKRLVPGYAGDSMWLVARLH